MLTLTLTSFSFLYGPFPEDSSGNGGGFVFDCRALPNPGRYPEYKTLSGKDLPVIDFLTSKAEMETFLQSVYTLVSQSVLVYQNRGFEHLMVNFGCTGGQHRSVYAAEHLAEFIREKFDVSINVTHLREKVWG